MEYGEVQDDQHQFRLQHCKQYELKCRVPEFYEDIEFVLLKNIFRDFCVVL